MTRHTIKAAAVKAEQRRARRAAHRAAANAAWGVLDALTCQRTAMLIAAWLLDDAQDAEHRDEGLADWLRLANPEHAREVATGVAVHALMRNYCNVWDALAAADAFDFVQADEWYFTKDAFVWSPEPGWLVEEPDALEELRNA